MFKLLFCLLFFPFFLHAGSVRLINNSPYDLRAVIRGNNGTILAELIVKSQKESDWADSYGQYGLYGGANANVNQAYRSITPYQVAWYCTSGEPFGVCDTVSTGAVVMSQGCMGNRQCKPSSSQPGSLYVPQPAVPLTQ